MSTQAERILEEALKLADAERADLAACLVASLHNEPSSHLDPAWDAEIERRLHAIDSGEAAMAPWEDAQKRIFGNG